MKHYFDRSTILKIIPPNTGHPGLNYILKYPNSSTLTPVHLYYKGNPALSAKVQMASPGVEEPAALLIVLQTLKDHDIKLPWDSFSFDGKKIFGRSMLMDIEQTAPENLNDYYTRDLRSCLRMIRDEYFPGWVKSEKPLTPKENLEIFNEFYRAVVYNTAIVISDDLEQLVVEKRGYPLTVLEGLHLMPLTPHQP